MAEPRRRCASSTGVAVAILLTFFGTAVQAQTCDLIRAKTKTKLKLALGRAYKPCTAPDTTTSGGIAACSDPSPTASQWVFDSGRTAGEVMLNGLKDGDVAVSFKVAGLYDQDLVSPAAGTGVIELELEVTLEDPQPLLHPRITTVPFQVPVAVSISEGKGFVKTTLGQMMGAAGLGSLGGCWIGTVRTVTLLDPNGTPVGGTSPAFSERPGWSTGTRG